MQKQLFQRYKFWISGLLLLIIVIISVTHIGEIERFAKLARQAQPAWLIIAVLLQVATYFSLAMVWRHILHSAGLKYSLTSLVPLSVAKMFSDQVVPSGGMSGNAFVIAALKRRGVSTRLCLGTVLVSLVAYFAAYLIVAVTSIILLWLYHAIHPWIIAVAIVFCLVAVATPSSALLLKSWSRRAPPGWLLRMPMVSGLLRTFSDAPGELLRNPTLVFTTTFFQVAIFFLDAATLWVMLKAIGQTSSFWVAFPSFILASIVATISLVPLGLGTFEATCVAMLSVLGIQPETALTSTLLLRGFTLWLPMLPGLWLARRALR